MWKKRPVEVIGVPMDFGANIQGAHSGPDALRKAALLEKITELEYQISDYGDISVPLRETLTHQEKEKKNLSVITRICQELCQVTYQSKKKGSIPICLGGDHSIAIGSIAGVSRYFREREQHMGLIWFDAHADINSPEISPTGNIHGMPVATLLGKGHPELLRIGMNGPKVRPENVVLIGIREIDALEGHACRDSGIHCFTMREIDEQGMSQVIRKAIEKASKNTAGFHVSFDLDGIDPYDAPGVSTPAIGGMSFREVRLALEMIAESKNLTSMDMVELNPLYDQRGKTAQLAVQLILSVLGKTIL